MLATICGSLSSYNKLSRYGSQSNIYSIYGMKSRLGNIGHTAHFGGAIGGYVTTLLFMPDLIFTDTVMVLLLAVPIIILLVMEKMGKI